MTPKPHRRHWHSQRKFKDGVYRLLSSHRHPIDLGRALVAYTTEGGPKLRYLKGKDGKYHIYEKVED